MEYQTNYATEAEYAEAFGIELPKPEDTPPAEPPAEPPVEPPVETPPAEPPVEGEDNLPADGGKKQEQTMEERAVWAARRREWEAREKETMENAVQARVDQAVANIFKGQVNPFTGKPITTEAEFNAYQTEKENRLRAEQMQKAGIDPETIQSMVEQQMAPYRQQMESAQLAAVREQAKAANARFEAALQEELKKVTAMDPNIKTLDDIRAMPTAKETNRYVQMGLPLEKAFYLANQQEVDERKMAALKASMHTQVASKGHLNPVNAAAPKTPYQVSAAEIEAYRAFMPDATEAEIQQAYERAHKERTK